MGRQALNSSSGIFYLDGPRDVRALSVEDRGVDFPVPRLNPADLGTIGIPWDRYVFLQRPKEKVPKGVLKFFRRRRNELPIR